jgi:DNA-directed RNA polymerase subunit RPC12/RpoP
MTEYECKECDKEFSGQQGLEDHNKNKHYVTPKIPMSKKVNKKYMWLFIIIILIVGYIYFVPSSEIEPGKYDDFAQCLTDSGAVFYGAYWCSHCKEQKKAFADSIGLIEYIECSLPNNAGQTENCNDADIKSYPTWEFEDGSRQLGFVPLVNLGEKTGCVLPE